MKDYFTIACHTAFATFYYVFDDEEMYRYSSNQRRDYTERMIQVALLNEEAVRLRHPRPHPTVPYTEDNIRETFRTHEFHTGELSRIIGSSYLFFDISTYTQWIMNNRQVVNIVETTEGICP